GSRTTGNGSCRRFPQASNPPISCLDNTQGDPSRYGSPVLADAAATFPLAFPLDLALTLGTLQRGPRDPTVRFDGDQVWRASRTRQGPALDRKSTRLNSSHL